MAKLLQDATKQTRTRKCKTFKCCKMLLEDGEARRRLSCVLLLSCDIPATFLRFAQESSKKVAAKSQESSRKVAAKSEESSKSQESRLQPGRKKVVSEKKEIEK